LPLAPVFVAGLCLQTFHASIRSLCSARIYGWRFACGVPLRIVAGNWINAFATVRAIGNYTSAKARGQPLCWAKTEHSFPKRQAPIAEKKRLSELITGSQWLTQAQLEGALASKPAHRRLGEHLVRLGLITERNLYTALSLQNDLPLGKPESEVVSARVTRVLPATIARRWRVLPFRIAAGELHVAGSEVPNEEMRQDIRKFSSLEIRFHLVTPSEYAEMAERWLA
jgi:hypothetical protein